MNLSGLSRSKNLIHTGSNSGYQAINLAYILGAERIILLGYDMKGQGSHFFGKHSANGLSQGTNYSGFLSKYRTIKPESYGIEIINCTRDSDLDAFPKKALEEVLSACS